MPAVEIPNQLTPVTQEQLIGALWKAWQGYFGTTPKRESLWVLVSQIVLETGLRYTHNFNLGNVKSHEGDGYNYQFFGCGEELLLATANAWKAKDPTLVTIKRIYTAGGAQMASVWVAAPHWASRFRAFHDLVEGATDHVGLMVKRFNLAWGGVERGDPALFGHLLKQQHYFTADEGIYVQGLMNTYKALAKMPFDYDALASELTEAEKERIGNFVGLSLQTSIDDIFFAQTVSDSDD